MAWLIIVTGTLMFTDPFGEFTKAYMRSLQSLQLYDIDGVRFKKRRFQKVIIEKDGTVIHKKPIISVNRNQQDLMMGKTMGMSYYVHQTMGSGKTVVGAEHLARIHEAGGSTGANFSVQWFPSNIGKPKTEWIPNLNTLKDFEQANRITVCIDDVKGTIKHIKAKEADIIGAVVNLSRKASVNVIFTTQRVINFIPPDIREVAVCYEVPIITIRDKRKPSPDGMGYPYEIEVLNISPSFVFSGFGLLNGENPDGRILYPTSKLLNAYSTLEIATKLGETNKDLPGINENKEGEPYSGYNNEVEVLNELKQYIGTAQHISKEHNTEHLADIRFNDGKEYLIDVVGTTKDGAYWQLNAAQKDFNKFSNLKDKGIIYLIAFKYKDEIRYIPLSSVSDKSGNIRISKEIRKAMRLGKHIFTPF